MIATMSRAAFMEEVEAGLTKAYGLRTDFGERALAGISEWSELHAVASRMDKYVLSTWWSTRERCGCVVGEYLREGHDLDREDADAAIEAMAQEIETHPRSLPIREFGIGMDMRLSMRLYRDGRVKEADPDLTDVIVILDGP